MIPPTVDDVATALELCALRVPDRHVTPDTAMAMAWQPELVRFDRAAVFTAARTWSGLRFPSAAEFFEACQVSARQIASDASAAAIAEYAAGNLETSPCPELCDHGWVTTDAGGHTTVRPCKRCRTVEYAVFAHRRRPGHDDDHCADCIAIKKGKPPDWVEEAARGVLPLVAEPAF